jgi:hypothetical protein
LQILRVCGVYSSHFFPLKPHANSYYADLTHIGSVRDALRDLVWRLMLDFYNAAHPRIRIEMQIYFFEMQMFLITIKPHPSSIRVNQAQFVTAQAFSNASPRDLSALHLAAAGAITSSGAPVRCAGEDRRRATVQAASLSPRQGLRHLPLHHLHPGQRTPRRGPRRPARLVDVHVRPPNVLLQLPRVRLRQR